MDRFPVIQVSPSAKSLRTNAFRRMFQVVCETGMQAQVRMSEAAKAAMVAALCVTMAAPQAWGAPVGADTKKAAAVPATKHSAPLTQDQRIEHALDRLTFGPKPGEMDEVRKIGLDAWFARQLDPASIDDSAFEAKLAMFPALKLPTEDLIRRFPSPQTLRRVAGVNRGAQARGRFAQTNAAAIPNDPVERVIYEDAIYAYQMNQKRQQAGQPPLGQAGQAGAQANDNMGGMADDAMNGQAGRVNNAVQKSAPGADNGMAADGDMNAAPAKQGKGKGKKEKFDAERMDEATVQAIVDLPPDRRMEKLLALSPKDMLSFRLSLRPYERQMLNHGLSPEQMEIVAALQQPLRVVASEALAGRLMRDVYSERQLQAVMTDFWLNHFSVYARKNANEPYFLASYERDTVLPHALGKFENLLIATAESPAMLVYLDNWQSVGPDSIAAQRGKRIAPLVKNAQVAAAIPRGINENYARELMELHTLSVRCEVTADHPASKLEPACGSGYTQADVQNVAKVLTGWTIERGYQGGGRMVFDADRHEGGTKVVLGKTIQEGGSREGMEVLHMLATHPATAHFVSYKLAVRFVSDNPPESLVDRMAATFLKTGGDIKAVLTTMFHSPEFWSPAVYRGKLKTPIEFMVSALRASDADVRNPLPLVQAMQQLGMPVYGMQTPNGYSWQAEEWASSNALVSRMNFAVVLSSNRIPGTRTDWGRLVGGEAQPVPETERKLETVVLGQPAAARTRETVLQQASNPDLQKTAAQNFTLRQDAEDDDTSMVAGKAGAKRPRARNVGLLQADGPGTPLDTMAGLLLGSPDFQRR